MRLLPSFFLFLVLSKKFVLKSRIFTLQGPPDIKDEGETSVEMRWLGRDLEDPHLPKSGTLRCLTVKWALDSPAVSQMIYFYSSIPGLAYQHRLRGVHAPPPHSQILKIKILFYSFKNFGKLKMQPPKCMDINRFIKCLLVFIFNFS